MNNGELSRKLSDEESQIINAIEKHTDDPVERDMLIRLFSKLYKYSSEHINEIRNEVNNELRLSSAKHDSAFNVRTSLMKKENVKGAENYFLPVISPDEIDLGAFFECTYEEFVRICDVKKYRAVVRSGSLTDECTCRLRRNCIFANAESIVFRLAEQYGIKRPAIFSPYARKYASVILDYCRFPENAINSIEIEEIPQMMMKLSSDYVLMWNLKVTDGDVITMQPAESHIPEKLVTPMFGSKKYKLTFKDIHSNDFILFNNYDDEQLSFIRNADMGELYVGSDTDFSDMSWQKISLMSEGIGFSEVFVNYYNGQLPRCTRVRTHTDIISTLNAFNNNPFGVNISEDYKIEYHDNYDSSLRTVKNYEKDVAYYAPINIRRINAEQKMRTIGLKSSVNCIIKFSGSQNKEDYANYVLEYLNEYYPEFHWQGEIV